MTPESLMEAFDVMVEAPNGVQKLRELILQLAVRGKLVAQDRDDEPASKLVERIALARGPLTAAEPARRSAGSLENDVAAAPYEVPASWIWSRLADIAEIEMGNSPPGTTYNASGDGLPLINGPSEFSSDPLGYTIKKQFTTAPVKTCLPGDLLICVRGATTGRTNIAAFEACIGRGVASIRAGELQPYLNWFMVLHRPHVLGLGSGSTFPSISYRHIADLLVPLPPLPEQHRIVGRVGALMAVCDQLKERQRRRADFRIRANRSTLQRFSTTTDTAELATNWERLKQNFGTLYDTPDAVAEFRQALLQLSMRGKLTRQNACDASGSALLQKIVTERQQRVAEGARGRAVPTAPVSRDQLPFQAPNGWTWARLGHISLIVGGIQKTPLRKPKESHYPYLRVANVQRGALDLREVDRFELTDGELAKWRLEPGDLLIVEGNGSEEEIGRVAQWNGEIPNCVHQNHLIRVRPILRETSDFLLRFLNSPDGKLEMKRLAVTTSGLFNLSVGKIANITVPIPPIEEQRRILSELDSQVRRCDTLSSSLTHARQISARLVDSVVGHAGVT